MSVRSVIVRLEAEVSRYTAGMGAAASATDNVARQVVNTRRNVLANTEAMNQAGGAFAKAGALTVAALGATAKAAMDWETAWTGVTKTVDGTPEQMDMLEASLRGLAKTLPITHTEIAGVAEAAGQLGVAREDVVGFTKTMIDLGVSTNLTAEDAATNIAQISNVMGTMAREGSLGVARFGSALVALGNDGASTEAEILSMAQRIAGAAATVGASETEVLALANTLASMGVKAELGGGVATRVLLKMYGAIQGGGEKLDAFAKTAGMSAEEFGKAFGESPVKAMDAVNQGLSRIKDEGGNVVETMKDVGLKGTEDMQVMLSLAASGDLLNDSLNLGSTAWKENTALVEEATKRYNTADSKVKVAWNNIKDAAIDAGAVMLPIIAGMAESVAGLASMFGDMNPVVQGTITVFAGVVGIAALAGGGLLLLIPRIAATRVALQTLNTSGSMIPGTLGKIGKAAGIAGIAMVALALASEALGDKQVTEAGDYANAIAKVAKAGADAKASDLDSVFSSWDRMAGISTVSGINSLADAVEKVANPSGWDNMRKFQDPFGKLIGMQSELGQVEDRLAGIGVAMAGLVTSGNTEDAAANFQLLTKEFEKNGKGAQEALDSVPAYKSALKETAAAAGESVEGQDLLNYALGQAPKALTDATSAMDVMKTGVEETGVAVSGLVEDYDKFLEQLFAMGVATMSSREANAAYHEALRNITPTMQEIYNAGGAMGAILLENGSDFDTATEAGAKANAAFQDLAQKGMNEVEAKAREGLGQDELQAKLTQTHDDLIIAANDMGITGTAAEILARKVLGVPDGVDIKTWMDDQARGKAQETKDAMDAIPGYKEVTTKFVSLFEQHGTPYSGDPLNTGPGSWIPGRATGGAIYGPGTGTSDDVPIMASNGEHMFTAAEVQMMGGQQAVYQFRAGLKQSGGIPGHATGGAIGAIMTPSRQLMPAGGGGASSPSLNATVVVENPWTGEQVQAVVKSVAISEANSAIRSADKNSAYQRVGR
ncbi:hypothetical protein MB46_03470 [Arthrobacter alpinus]|uniref:phage tail tape measure protein n=1 Tax=Arthrobacter alpinus TaxID=656366 RepID=UPI00067855C9|nr:phage tail tape measure protein [Arthrobacter alpinus]ALV44711.1 hypothetical protein MB46_03470 [Arthrobacter alpinus]